MPRRLCRLELLEEGYEPLSPSIQGDGTIGDAALSRGLDSARAVLKSANNSVKEGPMPPLTRGGAMSMNSAHKSSLSVVAIGLKMFCSLSLLSTATGAGRASTITFSGLP